MIMFWIKYQLYPGMTFFSSGSFFLERKDTDEMFAETLINLCKLVY